MASLPVIMFQHKSKLIFSSWKRSVAFS